MKVKCPTCGNRGVDRNSLPVEREDEATFAVYGHEGGRLVRKCLNCGAGVYVKFLPPRYEAIAPERWAEMQEYFEEEMAESEARTNAVLAQLERDRAMEAAENDPVFQEHVEAILERLNELWPSAKNPLMRETQGDPPGDLERTIIRHVTRSTSPAYVFEAMERGADPDHVQVNRETKILMWLMAGGYLWRDAERDKTASRATPLRTAESAVQWTNEHLSPEENERFEKLARAVFWTLESLGDLGLPSNDESVNGETALDFGFESMAVFACETEGLYPSQMILGAEDMRAAFNAGVALREVESYF